MTDDALLNEKLQSARDSLGEFFDAVLILVECKQDNENYAFWHIGTGSFNTRSGMCRQFLIEQEQNIKTAADFYQRKELE